MRKSTIYRNPVSVSKEQMRKQTPMALRETVILESVTGVRKKNVSHALVQGIPTGLCLLPTAHSLQSVCYLVCACYWV